MLFFDGFLTEKSSLSASPLDVSQHPFSRAGGAAEFTFSPARSVAAGATVSFTVNVAIAANSAMIGGAVDCVRECCADSVRGASPDRCR